MLELLFCRRRDFGGRGREERAGVEAVTNCDEPAGAAAGDHDVIERDLLDSAAGADGLALGEPVHPSGFNVFNTGKESLTLEHDTAKHELGCGTGGGKPAFLIRYGVILGEKGLPEKYSVLCGQRLSTEGERAAAVLKTSWAGTGGAGAGGGEG